MGVFAAGCWESHSCSPSFFGQVMLPIKTLEREDTYASFDNPLDEPL